MRTARTTVLRLLFGLLKRVNCGDLIVHGELYLFVRETFVASPRRHAVLAIVAAYSADHTLSQHFFALAKSCIRREACPDSRARHGGHSLHPELAERKRSWSPKNYAVWGENAP